MKYQLLTPTSGSIEFEKATAELLGSGWKLCAASTNGWDITDGERTVQVKKSLPDKGKNSTHWGWMSQPKSKLADYYACWGFRVCGDLELYVFDCDTWMRLSVLNDAKRQLIVTATDMKLLRYRIDEPFETNLAKAIVSRDYIPGVYQLELAL